MATIRVYPYLSPRIVEILAPATEITVQELVNLIRDWEDSEEGMPFDYIISAAGKEDLGGGVTVGITATLNNAKIMFTGRTTPIDDGIGRTCDLTDSLGRTLYVDDADFISAGVVPGDTVFNATTNEMATIYEVTDQYTLQHLDLSGAGGLGWTSGDEYIVYHNAQCSISGGNLVAVDEVGDPISSVFPSPSVQVVRTSSSSATLQELEAIQYSSYQNGVWYDSAAPASNNSQQTAGNRQFPVNNISLAVQIAGEKGFDTIYLLSNADIEAGLNLYHFHLVGNNHVTTYITIDPAADCENLTISNANVTGTVDGGTEVRGCLLGNINYVNGHIHESGLYGTITLGGNEDAVIGDCFQADANIEAEVDMGGSGQNLVIVEYNGILQITNMNGSNMVGASLSGGRIVLDSTTVTSGVVHISGIGRLVDENGTYIPTGTWNGGVTVLNEAMSIDTVGSGGGLTPAQIADAVWDEPLTGASHNVPTSAGRRLRDLSTSVITTGTTVSATTNTIELNGDAATTDGAYDPALISIVGGTGYGQTRLVLQYIGATKTAIVDRNWKTIPDNTSEYVISAHPGREHVNEGLAQAGTLNTITLNPLASSDDNAYVGQVVFLRSGTGEDQACKVQSYNGTTKVATLCKNWNVIPDNTSAYVMLPTGFFDGLELVSKVSYGVWDSLLSDHTTSKTFGDHIRRIKNQKI